MSKQRKVIRASKLIMLAGLTATTPNLVLTALSQVVTDRTLSRATVSGDQNCAEVRIEFNTSVQYQSHFPVESGREVRISLLPLNTGARQLRGRLEEELRPPSSDLIAIQDIQFEALGPTGGTLSILFDHEVNWTVEQGADFESIVIKVSELGTNGCSADSSAETEASLSIEGSAETIFSVTKTIPKVLNENAVYAVNLESIRGTYTPDLVTPHELFEDYAAYSYASDVNGISWTRLRVGFFETRAEAEDAAKRIAGAYPEAWVSRADRHERETVYRAWLAARAQLNQSEPLSGPVGALDSESEVMLETARQHLKDGEYSDAVRYIQRILGRPESATTPAAQELLGIVRERAGQLAHAKAEYEIYLQKYPDGKAAATVRQRLAVLISGDEAPKARLAGGEDVGSGKLHSDISGSLSVLFQRDESALIFEDTPLVGGNEVNPDPIELNQTNLNEMVYGVDLIASVGNDRNEVLFRFSGVHRDDLRADAAVDQSSISSLYVDFSDREWDANMRLGRQTRNTGGVFGRFDGVSGSVQASENITLKAAAGAPVQSSRDLEVDSERVFVGASVDVGFFDDKLATTYYILGQTNGDLIDRQAVGFEFRYFDPARSAYGVFDYDVHYDQLNLALLSGTYRFKDKSSFNLAIDYRRSPLLTTFNAIIGQGIESPSDLLPTFREDEIYQLAEDRTTYSRSAIANYSRPIFKELQLNFDVTATNVSGTKTSGGVPGQFGTGTEFYYSSQLVGSNFLKKGAVAIAGVRYADLQLSEQYTFLLNGRYPVTRDLRLNPRFRYDSRDRKDGTSSETSGRGSVRMTYNTGRRIQWESEIGGEWVDGNDFGGTTAENGFFFNLGVRLDF